MLGSPLFFQVKFAQIRPFRNLQELSDILSSYWAF